MLSDDVEMLMCHCRNSLSANGELLGAMTRIKSALESCQQSGEAPVQQTNGAEPTEITPDYSNHPCVVCGKEANCDLKCSDQA